jgi:hypothetical protein
MIGLDIESVKLFKAKGYKVFYLIEFVVMLPNKRCANAE